VLHVVVVVVGVVVVGVGGVVVVVVVVVVAGQQAQLLGQQYVAQSHLINQGPQLVPATQKAS
jgi:hypothetical protein